MKKHTDTAKNKDQDTLDVKKQKDVTKNAPFTGWVCPICGRGLSPFTSYCPCYYEKKPAKVTCDPAIKVYW